MTGARSWIAALSGRVLPALAACLAGTMCASCGGGSSPASPSPPAPSIPPADACAAIGGGPAATAIVNGTACSSTNSAVVLVNLRMPSGFSLGQCSATLIAPRAILTAAHCFDEPGAVVRIWLGSGDEIQAESYVKHPDYRDVGAGPDVGVAFFAQDVGRVPVPLLLSRDARVGETAVIAGWGRDQNSIPATLRAGTTTITSAGPELLETVFSSNASSICSGDSGGPILLQEGGQWAIAGVTSAASVSGCTTGTNYYVTIRNASVSSFVLAHVPDAARR
jgi:hypothetical protein